MGYIANDNRKKYFVLSGDGANSNFHSLAGVGLSNWMQDNFYIWGDRTLRQLCIPASHDSGMSSIVYTTSFANISVVQTQYQSVEGQANLGIRHFDIRPVRHKGRWMSGHYGFIPGSWQGGEGESIQQIVDGLNNFMRLNQELIILQISHVYRVRDRPGELFYKDDFQSPNADDWKDLLDTFGQINNLWNGQADDLTKKTLGDFIGNGHPAVVLYLDNDSVDLSGRTGVFHGSAFPFEWSDWSKADDGRLQEFQDQSTKTNPKPFGYSGCHTQSDGEAISATLAGGKSILWLSEDTKEKLFTKLYPACTETMHPAALVADGIDFTDVTALCMAVNARSKKPKPA